MKTWLAILLLTVLGLKAEVEFSGFFTSSSGALFLLTDTETRKSSGWLKIGQSFEAWTVISFDRAHDVLTLKKGGDAVKIPLRTSKVKDGRATISGSLTFPNGHLDDVRATLFVGEEASFPLQNGVTFYLKPEPQSDGNMLYRARFVAIGNDGREETLSAPSVVALPGKPFGIRIGDFGYSFAP